MNCKGVLVTAALAVSAALSLNASGVPSQTVWGRVRMTDGSGQDVSNVVATAYGLAACLEDDDLEPSNPGALPVEVEIKSSLDSAAALLVDHIDLSVANNFVLSSSGPKILRAVGTNSVLTLTQMGGTGDNACTIDGLAFEGANQSTSALAPYDGGALNLDGGRLVLRNCAFTNLVTRFSGGAVCARHLTGDSLITNCTFSANRAQPINGYGGAIYATKDLDADSVTLKIVDSRFVGNVAENGGAICTLTVAGDDDRAIDVKIEDRCLFDSNQAVYEGGAIIAEGAVKVSGTNTVFSANRAAISGGAICITGIVGDVPESPLSTISEALFKDNRAGTNTTWVVGGAIAVMQAGCELELDRRVTFENNVVSSYNGSEPAFGGAVYTASYVTNRFHRAKFIGNRALNSAASPIWCYGGAVSADYGATTIDTCVFDCGDEASATCMGNAIDFNGSDAVMRNTTCRRGQAEAISTYDGTLAITNCVIVGNALANGTEAYSDLYFSGNTKVSIAYSAYGSKLRETSVTIDELNTLTNRATTEVYDGSSLRLRGDGFNPVAGLGIEQTAGDYDGVDYGSCDYGYSMGAYETNTVLLTAVLDGSKYYNGNDSSNGCGWTWSSFTNSTDGSLVAYENGWQDLGALDQAYVLTNWVFASSAIGYYASTNGTLDAAVTGTTARVVWLSTIVTNVFTGTILPKSKVEGYLVPVEFAWTGFEIKPGDTVGTLVVSNTEDNILVPRDEYELTWANNVDPVAYVGGLPSVNSAYVVITCTNNYRGAVFTNAFGITAYVTEYYQNGAPCGVTTNGTLISSNVYAVIDVPESHCLDWQNSTTNATVSSYLTTLTARYETDVNIPGGDGIPDKYQKRVMFATVLGYWNGTSNGYDICSWVTLTNGMCGTEGRWSESGVCTVSEDIVPGIGEQMYNGFSGAKWLTDPTGFVVSADKFPLFFAEPQREEKPGRVRLTASSMSTTSANYKEALAITDFAIDEDGGLGGAVEAQIRSVTDGSTIASMDLSKASIEVLGAVTPGGEWFKVATVTTDDDGIWEVDRVRATGDLAVPKFFKVRLSEE